MKVNVKITLRKGVLDPQGKAITRALGGLGFEGVASARQGKLIELELEDGLSPEKAKETVAQMCERLLANTVMEDYEIEIVA